MMCLVYGIVFRVSRDHGGDQGLVVPAGVGGARVRLIEEGSLAAAVSTIVPGDLAPDVARALSFSEVVEALHSARTVLPMRYGCACRDDVEVVDLLRVRGEEYATILRGLEGCVEMGVRILLPLQRVSPRSSFVPEVAGTSGRTYLASRAVRYAEAEAARCMLAAPTERVRRALGRLAVRSTAERDHGADPRLSTLHFLVGREVVEPFREEFRRIERSESARLLLSGPWPPHNFATPEWGAPTWPPTPPNVRRARGEPGPVSTRDSFTDSEPDGHARD